MKDSADSPSFRLAYVPGVTPAKWARVWGERWPDVPLELVQLPGVEADEALRAGEVDAGLVRLPVDGEAFGAIPLYTETTVVVVPKDHVIAVVEEVSLAELADELVLHPLDDVLGWETLPGRPALERPATTKDACELVAAGVGVLLVPQSLARLHHRRDLTYRPVTEAPVSQVALCWPQEAKTDQVEDFIGVVRGRTVNSTRGRRPAAAGGDEAPQNAAKDGRKKAASTGSSGRSSRGAGRGGPGARRGGAPGRGGRGSGRGRRGGPRR